MHWRRKWQPTPVFLPGESQGWGSLVGYRLWGRTESDRTEGLTLHFQVLFIGCLLSTEERLLSQGLKIIFFIILEGNDQYMADVDSNVCEI